MNRNAACQVKNIFVFLIFASQTTTAFAVLDKFEPYAKAKVLYDSNVFRVSGDDAARALLGTTSKDDTIGYFGGGFESALKLSRQRLLLDAEVERVKYDNFGELDHTRLDGKAAWDWQVGRLWSGNLGYKYNRDLRSFNQSSIPEKDMRTTSKYYLDGGYQILPDWRLVGGLGYKDTSYQERKRLNRETTSGLFEVQYRTTRNTRVGVRAGYSDNDLREREVLGVRVNNDYQQYNISGVMYWEGSGKSAFQADFGYTETKYDELDDRDYNGSTGRLTYNWKVTGKTKLDISAWRETSTLSDEISSYVLTKGISIAPAWIVTPKINVTGIISYTNDDFKAENDIRTALGGQRRDDDTWLYRIDARWSPRRYLSIGMSYTKEDRDSSIKSAEWDSDRADVSVRFNF